MIASNVCNHINILSKAAQASSIRQEVLTNNIANVDTPNYKRKDVSFENYLANAISGSKDLDTAINELPIEQLNGDIYTDTSSLSYRVDGNNVDIDTESVYLAKNQIRYNTLIESISQEFSRLREAIK